MSERLAEGIFLFNIQLFNIIFYRLYCNNKNLIDYIYLSRCFLVDSHLSLLVRSLHFNSFIKNGIIVKQRNILFFFKKKRETNH